MKSNPYSKGVLKCFFILCSLGLAMASQAQNILTDKIQWNATGFTDLTHNTSVSNAPCQFISTATRIDWVQGNGSYTESFIVSGISGACPDLSIPGLLGNGRDTFRYTYHFHRQQRNYLDAEFTGGTSPINLLYSISTFVKP